MGGPDPKPHSMYCRGCSVCRPGQTWPTRIAALLLLLCACTTAHIPEPTKPLKVEITAMPVREAFCWMPEIPAAPQLQDIDFEQEDIVRRTMVHRLDYGILLQWAMEMQSWAEEAKKCLDTLRGVE